VIVATLILILVVLGFALAGLLWAGTLFLQNYLYTTTSGGVLWQAPAAAAVMTLFWIAWCAMDASSPEASAASVPYDVIFRFNANEEYKAPVEKLWSVKKGVKEPILYLRQRVGQNRYEYRDTSEKKRPWQPDNVEEILIEDKDHAGQKLQFKRVPSGVGGYRAYSDEQGWTMNEISLGQPSLFRYGKFFGNLFLNGLHLLLWFLCLWLLLRFQWAHALGLAAVLWLVTTLSLLWFLLPQAGAAAGVR
jgi:hypothetical protein